MSLEAAIQSLEKAIVANTEMLNRVAEGQTRNLEAIQNLSSGTAKPAAKAKTEKPKAEAKAETKTETKPAPENPYAGDEGFEKLRTIAAEFVSGGGEDEVEHRKSQIASFFKKHGVAKFGELPEDKRPEMAEYLAGLTAEAKKSSTDIGI